jgi:hypothetical protein
MRITKFPLSCSARPTWPSTTAPDAQTKEAT